MNLTAGLAEKILSHARSCLPNEACGLLAGDQSGIHAVYCIDNIDRSPVAYTIDPVGHFQALKDAERNGWELVGAFHSHVDGAAYPSPTDVAKAAEPDWVWLVAGPITGAPELRAFWIRDGNVIGEELTVGPGSLEA